MKYPRINATPFTTQQKYDSSPVRRVLSALSPSRGGGGALKTYPHKFSPPPQFFSRPAGAPAPTAPPGYAYAQKVD